MELSLLILVFGLLFVGLAGVVWAGSKAVLREKAPFAQASMAGMLMVVMGGAAASGLALVYRPFRTADPAEPMRSFEVLGRWIELDMALVSLLGLAVGYAVAFNMTLGGRWSRRVLLAVLAAVVTPLMLMGAERLVEQGSMAVAMVP